MTILLMMQSKLLNNLMIKYESFKINFKEEQVTLNYKSEADGLVKYETSFVNPTSLKEGEYLRLTLIVEHALINKENKTIH